MKRIIQRRNQKVIRNSRKKIKNSNNITNEKRTMKIQNNLKILNANLMKLKTVNKKEEYYYSFNNLSQRS